MSCVVCVSLSTTSILALQATTRLMSNINSFSVTSARIIIRDFPETAAFKLEKLIVSLSKLRGPTYQFVLRMRIYTLTVLLHLGGGVQLSACRAVAKTEPRGVANIRARIMGVMRGMRRGFALYYTAFHWRAGTII